MSLTDTHSSLKKILKDNIRSVKDFPKKGIVYKDITPLLNDRYLLELTSRMLAEPFRGHHIDYVAGLESRGFLFGTNLAQDLHAGFIPIRKPKKLPAETVSVEYKLEYGTDILEVHTDSINPGDNVLIHDDLVATGGSSMAATKLIEKLGGNIVGYSFVMEIEILNGRENLDQTIPFHSILSV
ncbi:adenine phosphoribosyltransferase [Rhodohalobacter barkolensis]|uniref:Adenine phosphoribosyltransferase n=1 Tax=Rhodohalobacter barkolensis TaxID=2053187 RepID=A0A2N0VK96_9BACT|nr:adenine phosphoribosyltransferase [Rhodohalobacter barkolensis]PKD44594.1 adenine phosphoribosyltransferase [Rhodohalobacter barkolensis]